MSYILKRSYNFLIIQYLNLMETSFFLLKIILNFFLLGIWDLGLGIYLHFILNIFFYVFLVT